MAPSPPSAVHDGDQTQTEHPIGSPEENVPGAREIEAPTDQLTPHTNAAGLRRSSSETQEFEIAERTEETPNSASDIVPIVPLTRKNLRRLENMVGSKGSRSSKPAPSRSSSKTRASGQTSKTTTSTKTLSTTAVGFEKRLRQNGVLHQIESSEAPPSNLDDLTKELYQLRISPAPSIGKYNTYNGSNAEASNEKEIGAAVERFLLQDTFADPELTRQGYRRKTDKQWLDYPRDQGFNNGLSNPKPDYVEGYKRSKFHPGIEDLGGAVTLDPAREFIALPHFAAEYKYRDAGMDLGRVQAGYDGAAMVHGRSVAMKAMGKEDPRRHAAVATAVTDGTTWHTYAHYQDEEERDKKQVYHQYPVASGTLDNYQNFSQGYRVLRNTQDFARRRATEIRDDLNRHYDSMSTVPSLSTVKPLSTVSPSEELPKGRRSRDSRGQSVGSRKRSSSAAPALLSSSSSAMSIDTLSTKGKGKEVLRPPPLPSLPRKATSYDTPTASSEAKRSPRALRKSPMLPPQTIPSYPSSNRSHISKGKGTVTPSSPSPSSSVVTGSSSILDRSHPPKSSRGRPPTRPDYSSVGDAALVRDSSKAPSEDVPRPAPRHTARPPSRHTSRPQSRQDGPSSIAVGGSYVAGASNPRRTQPRGTSQLNRERSDSPRDEDLHKIDRGYRERDSHHRRRNTGEHETFGRRW